MYERRFSFLVLVLVSVLAAGLAFAKGKPLPSGQAAFAQALRVDTPQSREALSVALRISQASAKLEAPKLSEGMLRSLLGVAFQGEADVDSLVDIPHLIKIINEQAGHNPGKEKP